jgi:RNA polymerase primary sigma factor
MAMINTHEARQNTPPDPDLDDPYAGFIEVYRLEPDETGSLSAAEFAQPESHVEQITDPTELPVERAGILALSSTVGIGTKADKQPTAKAYLPPRSSEALNSEQLYMADTHRAPLLNKREEAALSKRIQAGLAAKEKLQRDDEDLTPAKLHELAREVIDGRAAEADFVKANLLLVASIAHKVIRENPKLRPSLLDLIQDGNIGLMRAVQKFDWQKGFKFSTYGTDLIEQGIKAGETYISSDKSVHIPRRVREQYGRFMSVVETFRNMHGVEPTDEELAAATFLSLADVERFRAAAVMSTISLDAPLNDDTDMTLGDMHANPKSDASILEYEDDLQAADVLTTLRKVLTSGEYQFLVASFGFATGQPMKDKQVADYITQQQTEEVTKVITRSVVARLRTDALTKLRHPAMHSVLREFLPQLEAGQAWMERSACGPEDMPHIVDTAAQPNLKKQQRDELSSRVEQFKAVCGRCAVKMECLEYAKSLKPGKGIWGGERFMSRAIATDTV